jgi:acyl-coenzyme A synthetase/AMP-(fatty) acid ligase
MSRYVFEQAQRAPLRPAVVHRGVALGYGALAARIEAAAAFLARWPLDPTGVALLCVTDHLEAWVIGAALRRLGLTTAAICYPHEVSFLGLKRIACVALSAAEDVQGFPAQGGPPIIRVPSGLAAPAAGDVPPPERPEGGHLVVTSGTTGEIKKVLVDASNQEAHLGQRAQAFAITASSVVNVFDWGMWSSIGYLVPLAVWRAGGCVQIGAAPGAGPAGSAPFTAAIATPTVLETALADPVAAPWPGRPRLFVGGAPLSPALAAEARRRLTPEVVQIVASTEAGIWCATSIEGPGDTAAHRPVPGRAVEVVDADGRPLAPGEIGRIRIDVLEGAGGYFGDEAASRAWFSEGWFYPGDLGAIGPDGRLVLHGRASEIIAVEGMKLAPDRIERMVEARIPDLKVGAFSTPAQGSGEELHLVFEGARRPADEALRTLAETDLRAFPSIRVHLMAALPRNDRGKLQRYLLKQRVLGAG